MDDVLEEYYRWLWSMMIDGTLEPLTCAELPLGDLIDGLKALSNRETTGCLLLLPGH